MITYIQSSGCLVVGVEHVGGDMFEKVPKGCGAIFKKVNFELYLDVEMITCSKMQMFQ